jgi:aminopeptidase N
MRVPLSIPPLLLPFFVACSPAVAPHDAGFESDGGTPADAGAISPPDGGSEGAPDGGVSASAQDVLTTHLELHLATRTGVATISVQPAAAADAVVLDVRRLSLTQATVDGVATEPVVRAGLARFPITRTDRPVQLVVGYTFPALGETFEGWMPALGVTFTWPFFCGNLYPCNPSPDDGVRVTMNVTGVPAGQQALYPKDTWSEAPAYMPAIAVGAYEQLALGRTGAGTAVSAWYLPDIVDEATARAGTAHLLAVQDFFERRYGPYPFGPELGAVAVDWGEDSWGGIEVQPYYHVPRFDFGTEEVHAHEAAHAWYGNGVRIACWEDFVLSEGTVTYMAARGLVTAGGPDPWPMYVEYLADICDRSVGNTVALNDGTCNEMDFLNEWSLAHYMKGGCFYEEVADTIGWEALDDVLRDFYAAHVGEAARMQQMLEALKAHAPAHAARIDTLADEWLRQLACPADYARRCGSHAP